VLKGGSIVTTSTSTSTAATITTAATSSSIYSVSLDDVFYSQKASTKRTVDMTYYLVFLLESNICNYAFL
jgi:hypothetical protein